MAEAQLLAPVADTNRLPLPAMGGRFAPVQQFVRQPAVQRALPAIATTTAIGLAALAYFMTQSAPQAQLFAGLDDSDKAAVAELIEGLPPAKALVADRGYDAQAIVDLVASRGGRAHIPTQRDRKVQRSVDPAIYRQRNLVERFFCKLKHFRRVATRFDKLARNFLAAVVLASSRIWLRAYESRT